MGLEMVLQKLVLKPMKNWLVVDESHLSQEFECYCPGSVPLFEPTDCGRPAAVSCVGSLGRATAKSELCRLRP